MKISNLSCVQCQNEVPFRKIFFKGLASRRVICPTCHTKQFVALPALIFEYLFLVIGVVLISLNANYYQKPFIYTIAILIFLSSFIFEPFKRLVASR